MRVARWSATHPWRAVALWLVFVAACIAVGSAVGLREQGDLDNTIGQSGRAAHWVHDAHLDGRDTENVLITARSGPLDTAAAHAAVTAVTNRMSRLSEVARVGQPATSSSGAAVTVEVTLRKDADVEPAGQHDEGGAAALSGVAGGGGRQRLAERRRQRPGRQ